MTWRDGKLRRLRAAVGLGTLLVAGLLASGAFGMVGDAGSGTDMTVTATDSSASATDTTTTTDTGTTSTPADTTTTSPADTTTTVPPADTTTSTPSTTTTTTPALAPTLSTDKTTYQPGDTVTVTGANWAPEASLHLHVAADGASWVYDKDVIAAADGTMGDSFALPLAFAGTFTATATDGTGATATTSFSDAFSGAPVPHIVTFAAGTSASAQTSEIAAAGGTDTGSIAPLYMHSITFPSGTAQAGVSALQANSNVVRVEQDHSRDTAGTPNDPQYAQQWSLPRIGWDQVYGSVTPGGAATVAVLDTGVDASHPDLAGKVIAGTNAITGSGDGESDPNGHGTAMAGVVAAATNNGAGIAGVGYAGVQIMPVTVLNDQGLGYDSDVISGLVYAVQHHADVILMAFSNPGYSGSLQQALDWAWSEGAVLVAPTGNDGSSTVNYPAGDHGVVGVGNTDSSDNLNASSNTGADVFLAAPGTDILTTDAGGGYTDISGTSAAAAEVAGAAALIKAASVGASNGVIVNRLAANADPVGTSMQTGNGRLNLYRSIFDTSPNSIEPAGAPPNGSGGPFVGPYVAAATSVTVNSVTVSPNLVSTPAKYTISFTTSASGALSASGNDFIQVTFPTDTTVPASIAASNITVNGTAVAGTVSINTSQRTVQFNTPVNVGASATATVVIGAVSNVITNPTAATNYTVQIKTKSDNGQATSPSYAITSTQSTTTAVTSSANPSTYGSSVTFTATISPSPSGAGTVDFKDGTVTLCAGAAVTGNTATCSATSLTATGSPHTITANYSGAPGFGSSSGTMTQTVNAKALTVTADNKSRTYGDANPSLTFQIIGFVNGENASVLTTQPTCTTTATASSSVSGSPYPITCSGGAAPNYSFTYVNGQLTVTPALLTVTANNQSRAYGDANPSLTFAITGFKNGETSAVLTTQPTCTTTATGSSPVPGSPYGISCSGGAAANYSFSYVNGELTVTKAPLTVTADNQSREYGDANPTLTFQISGFKNGESSSALTTQPSCSTAATASSSVAGSPYPISCSGGAAANYSFTYVNGQLSVTPAPLTVTADNQSREYGDANPTLSFQITGFKNGETSSVLTAQPSCSTAATPTSSVAGSPYTISCSGAAAANYSFSYVNGQLTVTKAPLTVTADNQSREYGDANPTLTFQISGFKNGESSSVLSAQPSCSTPATATSPVANSPYTISCSGAAAANYSFSYVNGHLTVTKAPLTVTADNQSRAYGDANPTLTFQISGFKNGESSSALTTQPSCTTTATASSSVAGSPYPITCGGAAAANYSFSYDNGQLTVTKAQLTVTADNQTREYGDANPTLTFQISGFKNSETSAVLTSQPTCTTPATAPSSVAGSPYTISCSGAAAANYSFSYANGQLTVTPAPLTVTADNQSREYGDANPTLTFQINGFKNGETSSVLTTQPTCSTATASSSVAGSPYPITCGGAAAANYSFSYDNGQLTVTKAPLTVTADNQSREYGDANPTLTFQISGFKNGENSSALTTQPSCSTPAAATSSVAGSPYAITCSGGVAANYSFSYVTGHLTVTPALLTVTADNQSREYGDANPTLTFHISGFKNSEGAGVFSTQPSCTTPAVATSPVAGSPYTISCSGAAAANYSFSYVNGQLTVTKAQLTVTANDQSRPYGDANPNLTLQITGFKNSETAAVLSAQPTCSTSATATSSVAGSPYAITCSGAAAANYSFSYVDGKLSVTKAQLTVAANSQSRVYGDPNPTLTFQITGFKNGETASVLTTQPSCSTAATATSSVAGSPYAITCSGGAADNYGFSYVTGSLTVTRAPLTVTAYDKTRPYGDPNPGLTFKITGFKNGETASVLTTQPSCSTAATATSSVAGSPYAITCSGAAADNYSLGYVDGKLTITPALLTVTADNQSRLYGDANPTLTFQISGFKNGEGSGVLSTQPSCSTAATPTSPVASSPYIISCSGATAANYSLSYVNGQLTVTKATLTVKADSQSRPYGNANPTLTFQITGFKNGETSVVLTSQPACTTPATAASSVGGSPYTISCSGGAAANYDFTYVNGQLSVTPALLTVTADNQTRQYGDANPNLSFQITGFKNGETASVLTTQPACSTAATPSSSVAGSPYAITCSGAAAANYAFSYANGQLTVTRAPLTVTADDKIRAYGNPNPTFSFQISGFKNGETASVLTTQPSCSTAATPSSSVAGSPYAITCSGAAAANYSFNYTNGKLTITPALLTVTGPAASRPYGDANPTFTPQITGYKNGDTASSLSAPPNCSSAATPSSPVAGSPYAITCSGGAAANYSFSYVSGQLTVTKAPLTVTASNQSAQYSDATPALTFNIAGFKNGETAAVLTTQPSCTTTRTTSSPAATYPITCSGAAAANYSFTYVNGTFTVTQEDAVVQYSGDTIGQTGANLTLQATVWDSAASGFSGASSSGPDSTIGDITKIWIEFDVYSAQTCGSGTPAAFKFAQVVDTGAVGDGIGTATSTYTSSSEASYCVVGRLVANGAGGTNAYYRAPTAEPSAITFYNNTGQFVTGGGWVTDPSVGGHGNFGFNARYNKNNQPQGQFVYVWRSTYQGVAADYIIKSNSLTALGFTQTTTSSNGYPMTSTLQGKCTVQINRAGDGVQLASEGNVTFLATATDSGLPSSNAGDALTVTLSGSSLTTKSFTNLPLSGGNEVIHVK